MTKIQAPNYTQIPNVIMDYWGSVLTPAEFKVLIFICRKTFGFQKKSDKISLSQIMKANKLSDRGALNCIETLEKKYKLLKVKRKKKPGRNDMNTYSLVISDEVITAEKENKKRVNSVPEKGELSSYTKETLTKETLLKRTKKKKNTKQNTHCSSFQEIKKLMPEVSDGALNFWLKTWGYEVVLAAVKLTLSRKNVGNKAGYTRRVLNKGITDLNESDLNNKALAEEYAEVNKAIKVNKYYAVLSNDKEVYYKMDNQEFANILKNEFRDDGEIIPIEEMLGEAYVDYLSKQED